jgi:repressor LexA
MKLTPKQLLIVDFVREYDREHGFSPTLDEIAAQSGVSKVTIFEHMKALEKKGAVVRAYHKSRSVELAPELAARPGQELVMPLAGTIAAGKPIEAVETPDTIDISALLQPQKTPYVLKVRGNSMIDEQIRDGDYVIIEKRNTAQNGETVVALLPDGEATLKKFYREEGRIRLQPANPDMQPIYVDDCQIQGVVIGVLRCY